MSYVSMPEYIGAMPMGQFPLPPAPPAAALQFLPDWMNPWHEDVRVKKGVRVPKTPATPPVRGRNSPQEAADIVEKRVRVYGQTIEQAFDDKPLTYHQAEANAGDPWAAELINELIKRGLLNAQGKSPAQAAAAAQSGGAAAAQVGAPRRSRLPLVIGVGALGLIGIAAIRSRRR